LGGGVYVLTSHCNFKTSVNVSHVNKPVTDFCRYAPDTILLIPVENFIEVGQSLLSYGQKRFFKWRPSAISNFRDSIIDSLKSPCRTFYRSSAINCLVFEKIAFLSTRFSDRQTDEHVDSLMLKAAARYSTVHFCPMQ